MIKGKSGFLLLILLSMTLLTGCWDSVEIDQRGFVHIMGVDVDVSEAEARNNNTASESAPLILTNVQRPSFITTYALSKYTPDGTTGESVILSTTGESNFINRYQLSARMDTEPFLGHLKTILLGEEMVQNEYLFRTFLDSIERDPLISRRVTLGIVEGRAIDALNVELKSTDNVGQFISTLMANGSQTSRTPITDFNRIMISLHETGNTIIPKVTYSEDEIKMAGAAIVKNMKFAGWLGELESLAVNIILNQAGQFGLYTELEGIAIPLAITETKVDLKLVEENGSLGMNLELNVEAYVEEYYFEAEYNLTEVSSIEKIQVEAEKSLNGLLEGTIKQLQENFETDVLGFGQHIHKFRPRLWREIEANWSDIFIGMKVNVTTNVEIRRIGLSR